MSHADPKACRNAKSSIAPVLSFSVKQPRPTELMDGMEKLEELPPWMRCFRSPMALSVRQCSSGGGGWRASTVPYSSYAQADRFALVLVLGCGGSATA